MGGFYGSVQLRTEDRPRVLAAAAAVAAARKIKCLVGPALNGWIGVYPEGSGQDDTVGQQLAERVGGYAIHLLVHDDDILAYWLWSDGKLIDRYHSSPGYFGEENRAEEEPLVGDPEQFAFVLDAAGQAKLARLIDRDAKEVFEVERLRRLGRVLRIENVLTSYEYLKEADGTPVKGRRQFVEIPADDFVAAEKTARATAAKKIRDEVKRLKKAGVLLAQFDEAIFFGGTCAIAGGFVRLPAPHNYEEPSSLQFCTPPWEAAASVGFDLPPKSNPFNMVADWTGRRIAAQAYQAVRIWDWNGTIARHVTDVPTVQSAGVLAISPDGTKIAETRRNEATSKQNIAVHDVESHRFVASIGIERVRSASFSADGRFLLVAAGVLECVDLSEGLARRTFFVGGVLPEEPLPAMFVALVEKISATDPAVRQRRRQAIVDRAIERIRAGPWADAPVANDVVEATKRAIELQLAENERRILDQAAGMGPPKPRKPAEQAICAGFSRDGRWLWCGTDKGVSVFDAAALQGGANVLPAPTWTARPVASSEPDEHAPIHSVVEEIGGSAIVFAGTGSHLMRLDLQTGSVRSLVEVPGATFVTGLAMSPDGRYLGVSCNNSQPGNGRPKFWFQVWEYGRLPG